MQRTAAFSKAFLGSCVTVGEADLSVLPQQLSDGVGGGAAALQCALGLTLSGCRNVTRLVSSLLRFAESTA